MVIALTNAAGAVCRARVGRSLQGTPVLRISRRVARRLGGRLPPPPEGYGEWISLHDSDDLIAVKTSVARPPA